MSIISSTANYGGKIGDSQSTIKQFYIGPSSSAAVWIYKKLSNGSLVQTPADNKTPVQIDNNLHVNGSIYNPSDKNLKKNIGDINTQKADMLFTINPIHFNYKIDKNNKTHFGFLAQDIEVVFPELISQDKLGYKSVNYIEFIPLMLAKMKVMQNEIDDLKKQTSV